MDLVNACKLQSQLYNEVEKAYFNSQTVCKLVGACNLQLFLRIFPQAPLGDKFFLLSIKMLFCICIITGLFWYLLNQTGYCEKLLYSVSIGID